MHSLGWVVGLWHGGVGHTGEEAGGARSLRLSSPLCSPRSLLGPAPTTGPSSCYATGCSALQCPANSKRQTALTEPIGRPAWGCPSPFLCSPFSLPSLSGLHPLLALWNSSLQNAVPQAQGGGELAQTNEVPPYHKAYQMSLLLVSRREGLPSQLSVFPFFRISMQWELGAIHVGGCFLGLWQVRQTSGCMQ